MKKYTTAQRVINETMVVLGLKYPPVYFNDLSRTTRKRSIKLLSISLTKEQESTIIERLKGHGHNVVKSYHSSTNNHINHYNGHRFIIQE